MQKADMPGFLHEALTALKPPERLLVSEWTEKYRILDAKSSAMPGPWRNHVTPYLVDIMDQFNNPDSEEIIFVKPTQVGGTEVLLNVLGYSIAQDPYPAMLVYPTDRLGEYSSDSRIRPMLRLSPALKGKFYSKASQKLELHCEGMDISIVGANSPSSLASRPVGRLFLDEVDKYPASTKKEADPIKLARERTKTFNNRKIFMASTPTIREGHIWQAMETADEVYHYHVPCPHCGEMIELLFKQVKWPPDKSMSIADRSELASYVCQECGCLINDSQKGQMLNNGRWKPTRQHTNHPKIVAYWLNTLYSPFVRWSEIAKEWMLSQESPETRQNFINSWLAEPWEDVVHRTEAQNVLEKRTSVPEGVVPEWAELLTAGVDVQRDRLYFSIRAWGKYLTSQTILHGQVDTLHDIADLMNQEYCKEDGERFMVGLAAIDSGDQTDEIYDFCADNQEWAVAIKGSSHPMVSRYKVSQINKVNSKAYGDRLVIVDGGHYKDTISARIKKENGQGCWMVHADTDATYAEQIASERKVNEKRNGRMVPIWRPKTEHTDNHYLDCEVYAFCAADLMGVRQLHLVEDVEQRRDPMPEEDGEAWVRTEDWLHG